MLRIAVPNKGTLPTPPPQMLREAGYRQRADDRDLTCVDADNGVEFFYLRPRDIATYVGSGDLDLGITGRDLLSTPAPRSRRCSTSASAPSTFRFAAPPGPLARRSPTSPARRIATAYPGVVARFLDRARHQGRRHPARRRGRERGAPRRRRRDRRRRRHRRTLRQAGLVRSASRCWSPTAVLSAGRGRAPRRGHPAAAPAAGRAGGPAVRDARLRRARRPARRARSR